MLVQDAMHMTLVLGVAWFVVYWLLGGALFAVVALTRFLKVKKAQFSCLFTLASAAAAYGAATTGLTMGEIKASVCLQGVERFFPAVQAVLGCAAQEIFFSGSAWFALLILLSVLLMLLSERSGKTTA